MSRVKNPRTGLSVTPADFQQTSSAQAFGVLGLVNPTTAMCLEWREELPKERVPIPEKGEGPGQKKRTGISQRNNITAGVRMGKLRGWRDIM